MNTPKLEALKTRLLRRADSRRAYSGVSREHWHSVDRHSFWGGAVWKIKGRGRNCRFVENPDAHVRSIKSAQKILDLRHTGWYVRHDDPGETTIGLALYVGHGRWLAACSDPWQFNDKELSGPVIVECRCDGQPYTYDCEEDAARNGDSLAEAYGESCREDDIEQSALLRIEETQEEIKEARSAFRALKLELRTGVSLPPAICDTIRARLQTLRASVRRSVRQIQTLRTNPHSIIS